MKKEISAWIHPPQTAKEQNDLLEKLVARGVNNIIVNAKGWSGQAKYPSSIANHACSGEAMEVFGLMLEKSRKLSMTFEAWLCTFTESRESRLMKDHPECRAINALDTESMNEDGAMWPCPARETVKQYQLSICQEITEMFPSIRGIHLDYIRYPWSNGKVCTCQYCQQEFREEYGFDLLKDITPGGGATGKGFDAFIRWRCKHICDMVSLVRDMTQKSGHALSAAVFPFYPSILFDLGQDWVDWCQNDLLDVAHVMNYNWSSALVGKYTSLHSHFLGNEKSRLREGLWLQQDMSRADVEGICSAALENGAPGLSFFVGQTLAEFPQDILKPFI